MANPRKTTQASRVLWGAGTSRTIRAHWALAELGLDYESRPILPRTGETQTAEYTAINPRQKIPTLQDGDVTMTESAAIICYLSDRYGTPDTALLPSDPIERARCLEWCFFLVSEIDATSLYVMRRHRDLSHIYGEAPTANEAALGYFNRQIAQVQRALADGRTYLMGERFCAADIVLSTCITWAVRYELFVAPQLLAYNQRATARPAHKAAEARNVPPAAAKV
jgi:glutathione S-transferase